MYIMSISTTFSATEARQNFFQILRLAAEGHTIFIEKKDQKKTFFLQEAIPKKKKKDIVKMAKEMGKIGLSVPYSIEELNEILHDTHAIDLDE